MCNLAVETTWLHFQSFSLLLYGVVGCPLFRGCLSIEVNGRTLATFRIVCYITVEGCPLSGAPFSLFPFLPLSRTSPLFSFPSFSLYSFSTIRFPPPHLLSSPFLSSPYSPGYLHFLDSIHPHFDQLKSLAQHSPKTPLSQSTEETDVGVSLAEDSTTPLQDKDKPSPKVAGTQDPNASVCVVS